MRPGEQRLEILVASTPGANRLPPDRAGSNHPRPRSCNQSSGPVGPGEILVDSGFQKLLGEIAIPPVGDGDQGKRGETGAYLAQELPPLDIRTSDFDYCQIDVLETGKSGREDGNGERAETRCRERFAITFEPIRVAGDYKDGSGLGVRVQTTQRKSESNQPQASRSDVSTSRGARLRISSEGSIGSVRQ